MWLEGRDVIMPAVVAAVVAVVVDPLTKGWEVAC